MADYDLYATSVGHVYARALLQLAQKQNQLDDVTQDVRDLAELLNGNASLVKFAEAATITPEDKAAVMAKIFTGKMNPLLVQTLQVIARHDRLVFIRGFIAAYEELLKELANRVDVELTTATPLPPDSLARVRAAVSRTLGKEPDMVTQVDPELIGGLRIRVGDTLIDASVQTQLARIKTALQRQGSATLQKRFNELTTA